MSTVPSRVGAVKWLEGLQRAARDLPKKRRVSAAVQVEAQRIGDNLQRLGFPLPKCRPSGSSEVCLEQIARKRLGMGWTVEGPRVEVLQ